MDKEKAELYIRLYARVFLITETAENLMREDKHYYGDTSKWENLFVFSSDLLEDIEAQAKTDLTEEEYKYYNEECESPNRYDYE